VKVKAMDEYFLKKQARGENIEKSGKRLFFTEICDNNGGYYA